MGNRLSLLEHEDSHDREAEVELAFYRTVNMRFARSFFAQIAENMLSDFDIFNERDTITWRSYLKVFCAVRDKRDTDLETNLRSTWHTATTGYIMTRMEEVAEERIEYDSSKMSGSKMSSEGPSDDHTDDDGSDVDNSDDDDDEDSDDEDEDEEDDDEESSDGSETPPVKRKPREGWDPQMTSPIFFGYTLRSVTDHEKDLVVEAAKLKEAEERAVVRTKISRGVLLDTFEAASKNQENNRLKKIKKLEDQYNSARVKREAALTRMQADLPPVSFRAFKVSAVNPTATPCCYYAASIAMRLTLFLL